MSLSLRDKMAKKIFFKSMSLDFHRTFNCLVVVTSKPETKGLMHLIIG